MKCPFCTQSESKVLETRVNEDWATTRRRRECLNCKKRFTTYERVEHSPLTIVKKNGKRETFDRDKLKIGIQKACSGTEVTAEETEQMVEAIEQELRGEETSEIESEKVGKIAARYLKKKNKIAYIRFASVFKQFVDVEELEKEIKRLQ